MLLFNTTVVYADIGGDIPTPFPTLIPTFPDPGEFFIRLLLPDGGQAADYISEWLKKRWSTDEDKSKDMSSDGNTVTFNSNFVDELNAALQDKVHALDGYYLIIPANTSCDIEKLTGSYTYSDETKQKFLSFVNDNSTFYIEPNKGKIVSFGESKFYYYFNSDHRGYLDAYNIDERKYEFLSCSAGLFFYKGYIESSYPSESHNGVMWPFVQISNTESGLERLINNSYGQAYKVFYSRQDVENYLNKGRTYIPKLPSGGFKVNIKYINNTTNLPDITYNITTENKTETEIQNQYDTTINNYINNLNDFTDGSGGTTNPTPTPSGGGSGGDFGDGTTPTPKPDFSDGSLTDTNTLLQKILDKLTEFSTSHDKLAKTITNYIQKNDGKLEEILIAIQALSDGKTETEQNGCKYDFTALSEYLTKLWNDSDKKFDEMVKLLEENNKYQQKLVDSLNEIKALLIADTVMDFFKDRSQETAEKAKDKFPTSIPWDISLVLNSMSAEPKNPKFSLPIKIESFKINETIDIDLSTEEWEKLAKTCRYILSITFILFLIHLSRKLFSSGGDD